MSAAQVVEYGAQLNGARRLSVDLDGVKVLVEPATEADNKRARQVAQRIADVETDMAAQQLALDGLQHANEALATRVHELRAQLAGAEARAEAAIAGRRRFFGPVLLVPVTPGKWDGEVWLQDPVKRDHGTALRFASLAEVRSMHPELWIVEAAMAGILLDAWGGTAAQAEGRS